MNEDKMIDVKNKIESIDENIKQLNEAHDSSITKLRQLRSLYSELWTGLQADDSIKRLEKKGE